MAACDLTFAWGLGVVRLMEGEDERRELEEGDLFWASDACCLREGVMDVMRDRTRVGDASCSCTLFWLAGEDTYIDVVRIARVDPAIEGTARARPAAAPEVDDDGSKRGKFCIGGADTRLLFPDNDGIELDRRFELTEGTGTAPFAGRVDDSCTLVLVRTVLLPLATVAKDAFDDVRGLEMLVDDMEDPKLDDRLEKRAEDSEGSWGAI